MAIKDKDRVARANYRKKIVTVRFCLYISDDDIKNQFVAVEATGEKRATYIKRLIREDIARSQK